MKTNIICDHKLVEIKLAYEMCIGCQPYAYVNHNPSHIYYCSKCGKIFTKKLKQDELLDVLKMNTKLNFIKFDLPSAVELK